MNGVELKTLAEMKTSLIKFRLSKAQERWLIARLEVEAEENKQLREQIPDVVVTWGSGETAGINDAVRLRESVERDFALYRATVSVQLESAERRAQELEALFALQQTRMAGAARLWQEANNKPDILPDLGDLLSWLLSRLSDMEQRALAVRDALEYYAKAREIYSMTGVWQLAEKAIARADVHLGGREPQNYNAAQIAALQEAAGRVLYACEGADDDGDLTERVTGDMLFALRQALDALRRWPEPPKEDGRG